MAATGTGPATATSIFVESLGIRRGGAVELPSIVGLLGAVAFVYGLLLESVGLVLEEVRSY